MPAGRFTWEAMIDLTTASKAPGGCTIPQERCAVRAPPCQNAAAGLPIASQERTLPQRRPAYPPRRATEFAMFKVDLRFGTTRLVISVPTAVLLALLMLLV